MNKIKKNLSKITIPKPNQNQIPQNNQIIQDNRSTISQITSNLFISGYLKANDLNYLTLNNFTHVINCANGSSLIKENENIFPQNSNIKYLCIYLRDSINSDIIYNIFEVIKFIEEDNQQNKILFHCIEGISRGPALLAGYLMWKNNISKESAINLIKQKRNCVDINLGFIIQLNNWENYLNNFQINIFKISDDEIELLNENDRNFVSNNNNNNLMFIIKFKGVIYILKNEFFVIQNKINNFIQNIIRFDKGLNKDHNYEFININNNEILNNQNEINIILNKIKNY
jgi:protein-tyrosine phosphatase